MRALLDINVLIALHDCAHVHHDLTAKWFEANAAYGWASCPLTQNGCLRIMSQAAYANAQPLSVLITMLQRSTSSSVHEYWPDSISILDASNFHHGHMHSAAQLTDLYLLGLAVRRAGRLITLDRKIVLSAVQGAKPEHLVVL